MVPVWLSSDKLTSLATILTNKVWEQAVPALCCGAQAAPEVSVSHPREGRAGTVSFASLSYTRSEGHLSSVVPNSSGTAFPSPSHLPSDPALQSSLKVHSRAGAAQEESWQQPMQIQFGQPALRGNWALTLQ